jgi:phenylacetate-CoA ligase
MAISPLSTRRPTPDRQQSRGAEDQDAPNIAALRDPLISFRTVLARYALDHGRSDLRPQLAPTLGSVVTDDIREIVRKGLGAKIIDRYSCEETGYITLQCPKHNHMHLSSPVTMVEIVDENGAPCGPASRGVC